MIRISNSSLFIFGFVFIFVFFNLFNFSFAQEENAFLPTAPGTTDTGDGTNIFLQRDSQPAQTAKKNSPSDNIPANGVTLACPYKFTRELELGMSGEDVKLLQVLLNSDPRTVIATSGAGSAGKETGSYGESTKAAVVKFQNTFREYIGVANGRFGPRTKTLINQICSSKINKSAGTNFNKIQTNQITSEDTTSSNDKIPPRVTLAANFNSIQSGNTFKVIVNLSEPIKSFTPDSVIVDNGDVKEIRKLSKNSYAMTLTPKDGAKTVNVQIEAEKIEDMLGNLNENASNEVVIKIITPVTPTTNNTVANANTNTVDNLLNSAINSIPTCRYDGTGNLLTTNPITGEKLNVSGCKNTDPNKNYAAFNTVLKCYADNGELPAGIQETQRCSNPNNPNSPNNPLNPNNPNSPCSAFNQQQYAYQVQQAQQQARYGGYSFGVVLPPNPCQNAQVVQSTQQKMQQAAQNKQQQKQFEGLGQMLGGLLKNGGLGGMGNDRGSVQNNYSGNDLQPSGGGEGSTKDCDPNSTLPWNKCPDKTGGNNEANTDFSNATIVGKNCHIEDGVRKCDDTLSTDLKPCSSYDGVIGLLKPNCIPDNLTSDKVSPKNETPKIDTPKTEDMGGSVAELPATTKKSCPILLSEKENKVKYPGLALRILSYDKKHSIILFQERTGWRGYSKIFDDKILVDDPYIVKPNSTTESSYSCCKNFEWQNRGKAVCTEPGDFSKLKVYEIDYNLTKKEDISIGGEIKPSEKASDISK